MKIFNGMKGNPDRITGKHYFNFALYAFAGLGLEVVLAFWIEIPIYGVSFQGFTTAQKIIHWSIISAIWFFIGIFLIGSAKKKLEFDIWENKSKLVLWQYFGVILCLFVAFITSYASWKEFKILHEFEKLGTLEFAFQYLYYLCETFLFSLIIIFGQMAFEKWFKNDRFPYGGMILALTWGLAHIFTKGSIQVGLLTIFGGFLFGSVYLLVGKDYRKTLPLLYLMFVI